MTNSRPTGGETQKKTVAEASKRVMNFWNDSNKETPDWFLAQ